MTEKVIRFSISDGGEWRAATWRLWTPTGKADVYLACRELSGTLKASLHQSGNWHIAYSPSTFEQMVQGTSSTRKDRFIKKWPRPVTIAPGITLAFRIVTPYSAVNSVISKKDPGISWIPNCPTDYATEVDIFIISSVTPVTDWPGKNKMNTELIGSYRLSTGEFVWAVCRVVDMPDLSQVSQGPMYFYKGRSEEDLKSNGLRALVFGQAPDGSGVIFDCSVRAKGG